MIGSKADLMLALLAVLCGTIASGAPHWTQAEIGSRNFVVQAHHMQTALRPDGGTSSTCILVLPDAKLHVEKRIQRLPSKSAALTIFDSKLTSDQMRNLRSILDAQQIRALPHFRFLREYVGDCGFDGFEAKITREKQIQVVGYINPVANTERSGSSNPKAESVRKQWTSSQDALRPLVQWVDETTANLPIGRGRSTLCEARN